MKLGKLHQMCASGPNPVTCLEMAPEVPLWHPLGFFEIHI